jgi:hypothetical protein
MVAAREARSAYDFNIESVLLTTDRFDVPVEIANTVIEINIYEDINTPYLTGSIMFLDDANLYEYVNISGTERIEIVLSNPIAGSPQVIKKFVVLSIDKSVKHNDYSSTILLNIVEDHFYFSSIQKFSKMYDGPAERIIDKILFDNLNKRLYLNTPTFVPSAQSSFRVIVPYLTPLDAAMWVKNKATTINGAPYFLFSTLSSDDLVLADLETIIQRDPFNKDYSFVYSQAYTNTGSENLIYQATNISHYELKQQEDTLFLAQVGALGSTYIVTDVNRGETRQTHVDGTKTLAKLVSDQIIRDPQKKSQIDTKFIPDPSGNRTENINNYDSRIFSQVVSQVYPFDDLITSYSQETTFSAAEYSRRVESVALKQMLYSNAADIVVPGHLFLTNNVNTSVGSQIDILVLKNDPGSGGKPNSIVDTKRSGTHIITSKRHILNSLDSKHSVAISCCKLTTLELE